MNTTVSATPITHIDSDALILSVYPHPHRLGPVTASVDRELQGLISTLLERGDVRATHSEVTPLFTTSNIRAPRVLLVGLGDPAQLTGEGVRHAMAEAARRARDLGAHRIACAALGGSAALTPAEATQATVEGARLGLYRYARAGGGDHGIEELTLLVSSEGEAEAARDWVRWGEATAAGVELARDLVNLPPNIATPNYLAEVATGLAADHGFQVTIGDREWIEAHQMGAFLGVTQGAGHEPRFIVLEHDPSQGKEAPLVLVGKGVTFDSGGISIKGRQGMEAMKSDMAGAAAVLGAMRTLGRLRSPRRVVALIPSSENMLDAHAYRPADVLTASNGLTIEIISTDAEGRLLLADALVYAQRYKPRAVIDLATLTGAVVVALGEGRAAGRFTNNQQVAAQIDAAANASGERLWPLPLWREYLEDLRSEVADMKNSSGQAKGGAPVAAAFLERFVDYPWTHLDIAGMALTPKTRGYQTKGATGFGVRLLVHWVTHA
jgi:leucyl aminopeptidase